MLSKYYSNSKIFMKVLYSYTEIFKYNIMHNITMDDLMYNNYLWNIELHVFIHMCVHCQMSKSNLKLRWTMITANTAPCAFEHEVKSIHKEMKFRCKNHAIITHGIVICSLEESFFKSFYPFPTTVKSKRPLVNAFKQIFKYIALNLSNSMPSERIIIIYDPRWSLKSLNKWDSVLVS